MSESLSDTGGDLRLACAVPDAWPATIRPGKSGYTGMRGTRFCREAFLIMLLLSPRLNAEPVPFFPAERSGNTRVFKTAEPEVPVMSGNLKEAGRLVSENGCCYAAALRDGILVYGDGARVHIADVRDPSAPRVISRYPLPSPVINKIVLWDTCACIANHLGGVWLLDIHDLSSPRELWHADSGIMGVFISGNHLFVINYHDGLKIFEIADTSNPRLIGTYAEKTALTDVFVSGTRAYLASCTYGLLIIDVSDPANPKEIGHFDTGGSPMGVWVSGAYAFVADQKEGVRIIDIRDAEFTGEVGFFNVGAAAKVTVSGNRAYVANGDCGMRILDIQNPSKPVEIGFMSTGGFIQEVCVSGNMVYVADWEKGIYILREEEMPNCAEEGTELPGALRLMRNYPNPFNTATTIPYMVSSATHITLSIYNILGQHVKTLVDGVCPSGRHTILWDGKDRNGITMPSGVYIVHLHSQGTRETFPILNLK